MLPISRRPTPDTARSRTAAPRGRSQPHGRVSVRPRMVRAGRQSSLDAQARQPADGRSHGSGAEAVPADVYKRQRLCVEGYRLVCRSLRPTGSTHAGSRDRISGPKRVCQDESDTIIRGALRRLTVSGSKPDKNASSSENQMRKNNITITALAFVIPILFLWPACARAQAAKAPYQFMATLDQYLICLLYTSRCV